MTVNGAQVYPRHVLAFMSRVELFRNNGAFYLGVENVVGVLHRLVEPVIAVFDG
jgi:hypothetical protein